MSDDSERPSPKRFVTLNLLTAGAVALIVSSTAFLVGYNTTARHYVEMDGHILTRARLLSLNELLEEDRARNGRLPDSLAWIDPEGRCASLRSEEGQFVDTWKNPIHYVVDGDTYTLLSCGRDGQPGGSGLDADLDSDRPAEFPTLWQFVFEMDTLGAKLSCLLAGGCAGAICLFPPSNAGNARLVVRILATMVGAVFIAIILSLFHIPSGH